MLGFNRLNMGIIGTGYMAGVMAETIRYVPQVRAYAVASRNADRAYEFGKNNNFKMAYGSYVELTEDKNVDLIYIATPVTEHYEHIRMCIEHGKPVICEKPFALSAKEAEELFLLAAERNVFITDGMRLRFLPFRKQILEVMHSGAIGTPVMLSAHLAFPIAGTSRVVNPMLGGGALMEVGIYLLAAAAMLFGDSIKSIRSSCVYTKEGLDKQDCVTIEYEDGRMSVLSFTIEGAGESRCVVTGTTGYMVIDNITGLGQCTVYDAAGTQVAVYKRPRQKTGYEYVLKASAEAVREGRTACEEAPYGQTLSILHMTDHIRRQLGIVYPKEMQEQPAEPAPLPEPQEATAAPEVQEAEAEPAVSPEPEESEAAATPAPEVQVAEEAPEAQEAQEAEAEPAAEPEPHKTETETEAEPAAEPAASENDKNLIKDAEYVIFDQAQTRKEDEAEYGAAPDGSEGTIGETIGGLFKSVSEMFRGSDGQK